MKKQIWLYLKMEYKRGVKLLPYMVISFVLVAIIMTGATLLISKVASRSNVLEKIHVGMVFPESESKTKMLTGIIGQMESVHTVCDFVMLSNEQEAKIKMEQGDLAMAMVFPENFYEDVKNGINPAADVIFSGKLPLSEALFKDIMDSGVSMLKTAESHVYSVWRLSYTEPMRITKEAMGDYIASRFATTVVERLAVFAEHNQDGSNKFKSNELYYLNCLLGILLMCAIVFSAFYSPGDYLIEKKLKVMGISGTVVDAVKVLTIFTIVYFLSLIIYAGSCVLEFIPMQFSIIVVLALLSLCITTYIHCVFSIFKGNTDGSVIILLINVIMLISGGGIVASEHLPNALQWIGKVLPFTYWLNTLGESMFNSKKTMAICVVLCYAFGLFVFTEAMNWLRRRCEC